jgi:hypothetical protein
MDVGTVFDMIVADSLARSALAPGTTTTSLTTACKLSLLKTPLPVDDDTPREIGRVDPGLRAVIRQLVTGEAAWPLFLTGQPGRGKSAAALLMADYVQGSAYYRFTRLLKAFEWARTHDDRGNRGGVVVKRYRPLSTAADESRLKLAEEVLNERQFWTYLTAAPLVVVDDLATRGGYTEPQYDQFYDLLEERKRKPTVVVSNLSLADLLKIFDERIVSRLARGTMFTLTGRDQRLDGKVQP